MRAGRLRHTITIQQPVTAKVNGVTSTTWEDFRTERAAIETMKSFDKQAAQATMPGADVKITMRYVAGVTANMRAVDEAGTIYSILGRPNDVDGRQREMILTCQSGVKAS